MDKQSVKNPIEHFFIKTYELKDDYKTFLQKKSIEGSDSAQKANYDSLNKDFLNTISQFEKASELLKEYELKGTLTKPADENTKEKRSVRKAIESITGSLNSAKEYHRLYISKENEIKENMVHAKTEEEKNKAFENHIQANLNDIAQYEKAIEILKTYESTHVVMPN